MKFAAMVLIPAESVAVGVVLKNPLKGVPLLLTNLCLVWEATPTTTPTPSSPSPAVAAVCEVVERVLLQPEEEKMVCQCACVGEVCSQVMAL